jgi:nucleoside-diphosphate-sugar epimerase
MRLNCYGPWFAWRVGRSYQKKGLSRYCSKRCVALTRALTIVASRAMSESIYFTFMRILFTGATSFAGREFFRQLAASGHDVTGVSRKDLRNHTKADLSDPAALRSLPDEQFDMLVHCASYVPLNEQTGTWEQCAPANIDGTVHLLTWAEGRVRRVILVSSCAVYGSAKAYTPTDESHPVRPDTIYAITKYAQEQIVHAFCTSRNMPLAIMRLGYVYGPDIHPSRAVAKLLQGVVEGQGLTLRNADSAGLHLIHTSDIARIGIGLLGSGSGVYNVVSPEFVSLRRYVETAMEVVGQRVDVKCEGDDSRVSNWYATSLGRVGLLPNISLKDGIRSMLADSAGSRS